MDAAQWEALNRERGELIDKQVARTITPEEDQRLAFLQGQAAKHLDEISPRITDELDLLESRLDGIQQTIILIAKASNEAIHSVLCGRGVYMPSHDRAAMVDHLVKGLFLTEEERASLLAPTPGV